MVQPGDLAGAYHHVACGVGPRIPTKLNTTAWSARLHGQLVVPSRSVVVPAVVPATSTLAKDWLLLPGLALGRPSLDGARLGLEAGQQQQAKWVRMCFSVMPTGDLGERLVNDLLPVGATKGPKADRP